MEKNNTGSGIVKVMPHALFLFLDNVCCKKIDWLRAGCLVIIVTRRSRATTYLYWPF